ncbi:MAG TPA: ABC transporter permease [Syntrophomonadaceae bacterium]|nr:ABC transporter permease [Syntrophomonadaceae bacterium]
MINSWLANRFGLRVEKQIHVSPWISLFIPFISIVLALLVGAVFLSLTGNDPWKVYGVMFKGAFGSVFGLSECVVNAIPLLMTGLAVALAFRMLLWNIGAEGQFYMGAFAASWVALSFPHAPAYLVMPGMFLAGFAGGALWGLLPAIPRALLGVNETLTTLMLNYVAILWVDSLVYGHWRDPQGYNFPLTAQFSDAATLPSLGNTRIHAGVFLALAAAVVVHIILKHTVWGYEIRIIGESQKAAKYAGINVVKNILLVMMLSGGLSGLAGYCEVAGITHRLQESISPGYGYTAIIVAWLGKLNPWAIMVVSFLFGGFLVGGYTMQSAGLPAATVSILQGSILFFVLAGEILTRYRICLVERRNDQ